MNPKNLTWLSKRCGGWGSSKIAPLGSTKHLPHPSPTKNKLNHQSHCCLLLTFSSATTTHGTVSHATIWQFLKILWPKAQLASPSHSFWENYPINPYPIKTYLSDIYKTYAPLNFSSQKKKNISHRMFKHHPHPAHQWITTGDFGTFQKVHLWRSKSRNTSVARRRCRYDQWKSWGCLNKQPKKCSKKTSDCEWLKKKRGTVEHKISPSYILMYQYQPGFEHIGSEIWNIKASCGLNLLPWMIIPKVGMINTRVVMLASSYRNSPMTPGYVCFWSMLESIHS